jgi:hypothetical protein
VAAKRAHPTVRVVAIANPASGPGRVCSPAYVAGIAELRGGGVEVIGYVATGYGRRRPRAVQAEVDRWRAFYPQVSGIFFDEQSSGPDGVAHYRALSRYAKARGLPYTVGNPGAAPAEGYVGALDTLIVYESPGLPPPGALPGWHVRYAPGNFGVIPYATPLDTAYVRAVRASIGHIYLSDDTPPNPWDRLPPYFGELLAALE